MKNKSKIILRVGIILVLLSIAILMVVNYYTGEGHMAVHIPPPLYKS